MTRTPGGSPNLRRHDQCFVDRERALRDSIGECWPFHELHHEGRCTVVPLQAVVFAMFE